MLMQEQHDQLFEHWWRQSGAWVEPPNERRGGVSGVQCLAHPQSPTRQVYLKRQTGHIYRSLRYPFGRPTVLREQLALQQLASHGIHVPRIEYCAARKCQHHWQALLVTRALAGYQSLDQWLADYLDGRHSEQEHSTVQWELAKVLKKMHRLRWQHGCCYPKHIFIGQIPGESRPQVALLDLEKARRRFSIAKASQKDLSQLFRHCPLWQEPQRQRFLAIYQQL